MIRRLRVVVRALRAGAACFAASAFAISLFSAPTARADIFTSPTDLKASAYQQAFELIPAPFRPSDDDVIVKSVTQDDFAAVLRRSYPSDAVEPLNGLYLPRNAERPYTPHLPRLATILMDRSLSRTEAKHTFVHEWGHHVFTHLLTDEERADFEVEWEMESTLEMLPTPYAYKNVGEGFAECFEAYIFKPESLTAMSLELFDGFRRSLSRRLSPDARSYTLFSSPTSSAPPVEPLIPLIPFLRDDFWWRTTLPVPQKN